MTVPCWDLQRNAGARRHIFITFLNNHLQDYTIYITILLIKLQINWFINNILPDIVVGNVTCGINFISGVATISTGDDTNYNNINVGNVGTDTDDVNKFSIN